MISKIIFSSLAVLVLTSCAPPIPVVPYGEEGFGGSTQPGVAPFSVGDPEEKK